MLVPRRGGNFPKEYANQPIVVQLVLCHSEACGGASPAGLACWPVCAASRVGSNIVRWLLSYRRTDFDARKRVFACSCACALLWRCACRHVGVRARMCIYIEVDVQHIRRHIHIRRDSAIPVLAAPTPLLRCRLVWCRLSVLFLCFLFKQGVALAGLYPLPQRGTVSIPGLEALVGRGNHPSLVRASVTTSLVGR